MIEDVNVFFRKTRKTIRKCNERPSAATSCQIVRPETILAWFRQLAADRYDSSKPRRAGRPRKAADLRELVLEMARDKPGWGAGWGYMKIRDALRGLKIEIGRTTVATLLREAGVEPAPERKFCVISDGVGSHVGDLLER
jgi:transposase